MGSENKLLVWVSLVRIDEHQHSGNIWGNSPLLKTTSEKGNFIFSKLLMCHFSKHKISISSLFMTVEEPSYRSAF